MERGRGTTEQVANGDGVTLLKVKLVISILQLVLLFAIASFDRPLLPAEVTNVNKIQGRHEVFLCKVPICTAKE